MAFGIWRRQPDPVSLVRRAQEGDGRAREDLIEAYTPFVLRVAASVCGRFVALGRDDEASVALIAFGEAIDAFRPDRGGAFLSFAETVIRRRLVDYFRQQKRREVPLSELEVEDEEGNAFSPAEVDASLARHAAEEERRERQAEIASYQALLAEYGITFAELARLAPRHRDAREAAKAVARRIASEERFLDHLRRERALPLAELYRSGGLPVSRKTVERNRKYIIALTLILAGDFPFLREYVRWGE